MTRENGGRRRLGIGGMDRVECVVVGAGVVGLAVARALATAGREVLVLEAEGLVGSHTSSRNSEVIHAGIYYPAGSAKARLCVRGKHLLYAYCAARGVAHRRLGKIIVATDPAQAGDLAKIDAAARGNGVDDLRPLDAGDLRRLEPALRGVAGLLSPSTGIVDSHGLMLSLQGEAEDHGAMVAFRTRLEAARPVADGLEIEAVSGSGPAAERLRLRTGLLVNAAGLFAGEVAARVEGLAPPHRRPVFYCKGTYFGVAGRVPFSRLIYPVPERDGLGVHLTLDLAGRGRFGPDTEWIEGIDYGLDPARGAGFYAAIRRYWPGLADGALAPDYTGIRPKLAPAGGPATDFTIEGPGVHGIPGLVNLFGIESPGLTASLAIAGEVLALAEQRAAA
jgi:L-2-hydroxyglutarate oxidase LhgO